MKAYADLADLPENERIKVIAKVCKEHLTVFVVEDDAKADHYVRKLKEIDPNIREISRYSYMGVIWVKVGPSQ